jgi:hypothetical protein
LLVSTPFAAGGRDFPTRKRDTIESPSIVGEDFIDATDNRVREDAS